MLYVSYIKNYYDNAVGIRYCFWKAAHSVFTKKKAKEWAARYQGVAMDSNKTELFLIDKREGERWNLIKKTNKSVDMYFNQFSKEYRHPI